MRRWKMRSSVGWGEEGGSWAKVERTRAKSSTMGRCAAKKAKALRMRREILLTDKAIPVSGICIEFKVGGRKLIIYPTDFLSLLERGSLQLI